MKMFGKKSLIIALLLMISGGVLIVLAFIIGGFKMVVINSNGIQVLENKEIHYKSDAYKNIKDINIDTDNCKIIFEQSNGDDLYYEINMNSFYKEPETEVIDGKLNIKAESVQGIFINVDFWRGDNCITVYVPKNYKLDNVTVKNCNGAIISNADMDVTSIGLKTDNGKIQLNNNIAGKTIALKSSNGSISCSGEFKGDASFKTSNGSINLDVYRGEVSKYNYDLKTSNGKIMIDKERVNNEYNVNNRASKNIVAETANGSININFKK